MNVLKMQQNHCGFFTWVDPPMCARSKEIIPGLLRRINTGENEIKRYKRRERTWMVLLLVLLQIIFFLLMDNPSNGDENAGKNMKV